MGEYWGMREGIDEASMLTGVMITYCLLNTLKNYQKNNLETTKKPLQRLDNLPVSRNLCLARASSSCTLAVCRLEPMAFTQLSKDIVFRVPPS